ncbi:hypothetical protein DV515_00013238, partial [Chloebia gouldiae]
TRGTKRRLGNALAVLREIHIEKITTWQDPRKPMNQALNHLSHHPAATSTPAPQRTMAMSQPNL